MRYRSATAFRQALGDQIRREARTASLPAQWLWKVIAFERMLARLVESAPGAWVLKGGFALDLRLGNRARTTRDVDLAWLSDAERAEAQLVEGLNHGLDDYFAFRAERARNLNPDDVGGAIRYRIHCDLANQRLVWFYLDVGFDDPIPTSADMLRGSDLLSFSGIASITVPVLPLSQHVAEKLHAYTRRYGPRGETSSRVKDLVDMILIQANERLDAGAIRNALEVIFATRSTHDLPMTLAPPPDDWRQPYRELAADLAIPVDLGDGYRRAAAFLTPVLDGSAGDNATWDPDRGRWV